MRVYPFDVLIVLICSFLSMPPIKQQKRLDRKQFENPDTKTLNNKKLWKSWLMEKYLKVHGNGRFVYLRVNLIL